MCGSTHHPFRYFSSAEFLRPVGEVKTCNSQSWEEGFQLFLLNHKAVFGMCAYCLFPQDSLTIMLLLVGMQMWQL